MSITPSDWQHLVEENVAQAIMMRKVSNQVSDEIDGTVFYDFKSLSRRIYFKQYSFEFVQALTNHSQAWMTLENLRGDERFYQEGFTGVD